jgi:acetyl-CoA C-acetyltransferase
MTPAGKRTLAHIDVGDPAMLAFFTGGLHEPVGTAGRIDGSSEAGSFWRN